MAMMPMMLGFLTLSFPMGLGLYLLISHLMGIAIQYFVTGWGSLFPTKKVQEAATTSPTTSGGDIT